MTNNGLTLPLTKPKRPSKAPRNPKPFKPKEHARGAFARWLEAPTNPAHWDCLINALIDVELQARLVALAATSETPNDGPSIHLG